ncbi:MAG: TolC family protein [Sphingobacteriales bacterium]|nr:MAG: TolC family protein [Sphingobacteriales bacterium]TAF81690.1 MAG: TolC family protein [Sphingobacteriales bacterium]
MKKLNLVMLLFASCLSAIAQNKTLSLDEYLAIIQQYHPVAKQAFLFNQKAKLNSQMALGGFDPKLSANKERKIYDGVTYYNYFTPEIKVPLWYGIDLKGSYTEYEGAFVSPENKVPKNGLSYVGLSLPIGRGLFIDDRRAALKQARIYQSVARNERQIILNDLFLDATQSYTEWLNAYQNTKVYTDAVKLALIRFEGTKQLFINGDKPAIDTLEALILLQNRQFKLNEYQQQLTNTKNALTAFLWLENNVAIDPEKININPDSLVFETPAPTQLLQTSPATIAQQNPEVQAYIFKLQELDIERRLKLEEIKPTLNFNLGVLNGGRDGFQNFNTPYINNNQKFGFSFSMPLTFTKQRAAYSLSKIKIQDATFTLNDKQNQIANKWRNYLNDYFTFTNQIALFEQTQANNKALLKGEETKFRFGDSSLFLINSREQKVLETQEKINELKAKKVKTIQVLKYLSNSF